MNAGEQHAWASLISLDPSDVCSRTGAAFDRDDRSYRLDFFNQRVTVSLAHEAIIGSTPEAKYLVDRLSYFSHLSLLSFLINGRDIPCSGNLVRPAEMSGMEAMVRGSHTLPLHKLTTHHADSIDGFLQRGATYGGTPQSYGDASLLLEPFKVLPVVLILWVADEEFPARSDLLLDRSSESQVPADILWCIMMLTILAMM